MKEENKMQYYLHPPMLIVRAAAGFLIIVSMFFLVKTSSELRGYNRVQAPTTVSVSGEGKEFVKPDIATISVGVVKQNADLLKAQNETADAVNRVVSVLKNKGVADKDQRTISFNINPQYDYTRSGRKFLGYEIRQTIEAKIRDLSKVGDILASVAGAGSNEIGSLNFTVDDPKIAQEKARAAAITEAKNKAKALSRDLGVRLTKIISYNESSGGNPSPIPYFTKASYGMGAATEMAVPTGENEILMNVTITYEIK